MSSTTNIIPLLHPYLSPETNLYLVGGYVRDRLLDIESKDIDLVTTGDPYAIARRLHAEIEGTTTPIEFRRFGTVQLKVKGMNIEIVRARKESYRPDSRNPIVSPGTLQDDILRRDFTINCLMIKVNQPEKVIDLTRKGMDDLNNRLIRTPLDPDKTFTDDPLRMMRAVVLAAKLGFTITDECAQAIKRNIDRMKIITPARIRDEFQKILSISIGAEKSPPDFKKSNEAVTRGIDLLIELGLMNCIIPELSNIQSIDKYGDYHQSDAYEHTKRTILTCEYADPIIRLAILLYNIGKWQRKAAEPEIAQNIMQRLKFSKSEIAEVTTLVRNYERIQKLYDKPYRPSTLNNLINDVEPYLSQLLIIAEAEAKALNQNNLQVMLTQIQNMRNEINRLKNFQRNGKIQLPINGSDIMEIFEIEAGTKVGLILKEVEKWIIEGEIAPGDRHTTLTRLQKYKHKGIL
ncbi:MAG: hypothetical protein HQ591_11650 [candidate division Zixibacteria bacterium]|nr:hypothetical protein [Candidatus Tariuqbacter arcticus]